MGCALSFYLGPSGEYFSGPDGTKNQFVDFVLCLYLEPTNPANSVEFSRL